MNKVINELVSDEMVQACLAKYGLEDDILPGNLTDMLLADLENEDFDDMMAL